MKKTTAFLFVFSSLLIFSTSSIAQLKLPGTTSPDLRQALEKVISDYPKNFATLKGEEIATNPQTVEYASLLKFALAEQNTITEYSGRLPVYSWQAQILTTEEFETAQKRYKALYRELKSLSLTLNRDYSYGLTGDYDAPDESRKFATTIFRLTPNAAALPKVKVQLSMQYELPEWKVTLAVYQREREDDEKGKTTD